MKLATAHSNSERNARGQFLSPSKLSAAGGRALRDTMTSEQRSASALRAAKARWAKRRKPVAA